MKKTRHTTSFVPMEEYYSDEKGQIFRHVRLNGGRWDKQLSPYTKLPWLEVPSVK